MLKVNHAIDLAALDRPLVCIVKLATQPPNVLQQVMLRPDKVSAHGYIRLGETEGDEAYCWIKPENVLVCDVLGEGFQDDKGKWGCRSLEEDHGLAARAA